MELINSRGEVMDGEEEEERKVRHKYDSIKCARRRFSLKHLSVRVRNLLNEWHDIKKKGSYLSLRRWQEESCSFMYPL